MTREEMKQVLNALKKCHYYMIDAGLPNQSLLNEAFTVITALRQAIEQAEQPCDLGEIRLGCSPRNADGSCPDRTPQRQELTTWAVPHGYALVHESLLRAWGKLDEVKAACVYPLAK